MLNEKDKVTQIKHLIFFTNFDSMFNSNKGWRM